MKKEFSLIMLLTAMLTLISCKDDAPLPTTYTMYQGETQYIESLTDDDLMWNSENEFVATIKSNVITGQYVGKTIVKSTTTNQMFYVEVKPRYNIYEEPCLEWGASKATIKAKYGTPQFEDSNNLMYQTHSYNAPVKLFVFENGELSTSVVVCSIYTADQLGDFLMERYIPIKVDEEEYSAILLHCYGEISNPQIDYGVAMQYNPSIDAILVAYTPVISSKSLPSDDINFNVAFKSIEKVLGKNN